MSAPVLTPADMRYFGCELFQIGLRELRSRPWGLLSPTEMLMAAMIAEGMTLREIAGQLGKARSTIKTQLSVIYGKLGLGQASDGARDPRVRLGVYWNCELFQIGLQAII